MFEELKDYLTNVTSPQNVALAEEAFQLLEKAGCNQHQSDLNTILETAESHATESNVIDIFDIFEQYMEYALNNLGVQLAPNTSLVDYLPVLNGLLIIPEYGDPQHLVDIFSDTENSSETQLAEALAAVDHRDVSSFEMLITYASPDQVAYLKKTANDRVEDKSTNRDIGWIRSRFTAFRAKHPDTLGQNVIENGLGLGMPVSALVAFAHTQLDALEGQPKELPLQVFSLVLISDTPNKDLFGVCEATIEDFGKDINVVTQTRAVLTKLLREMPSEEA